MKTTLAEFQQLACLTLGQHGVTDAAACAHVVVQAEACGLETHGVLSVTAPGTTICPYL